MAKSETVDFMALILKSIDPDSFNRVGESCEKNQ